MGGIVAEKGERQYQIDGYRTSTSLSRDLVDGDVVVFDSTAGETSNILLSSGPTERIAGVVGQIEGAEASVSLTQPATPDAAAWLVLWGRNVKVRIQDNATVADGADLALSATTPGALLTATVGQTIVATAKEAIISGAVYQFLRAYIYPPTGGIAP